MGELFRGVIEAGLDCAEVEVEDLLLLGELLAQAVLDDGQVDGEQLRDDADVDHVLDQLAQLGLRTDGGGDLVEGHRIADDVVAVLLEVEALFVDGDAAGGQREHVLLRRLGVQCAPGLRASRLRATYPSLLARMVYQVGRPAMFEGNRFLPLTGTPIPKMLFSRTLLADCEPDPFTVATWMLKSLIDALTRADCALFLTQGQVSCRHLAGFPSDDF